MDTLFYQSLKMQIVELVDLSKDAIHIHIGLFVLLLSVVVWQRGDVTVSSIGPVIFVAIGMEVMDLLDNLNSIGRMLWANSLHDLLNTVVWPAIIVFVGLSMKKRVSQSGIPKGKS